MRAHRCLGPRVVRERVSWSLRTNLLKPGHAGMRKAELGAGDAGGPGRGAAGGADPLEGAWVPTGNAAQHASVWAAQSCSVTRMQYESTVGARCPRLDFPIAIPATPPSPAPGPGRPGPGRRRGVRCAAAAGHREHRCAVRAWRAC